MTEDNNLKMIGNHGLYLHENTVLSFQVGTDPVQSILPDDPGFNFDPALFLDQSHWQTINGYNIASRGYNDLKCQEVANDIKQNPFCQD